MHAMDATCRDVKEWGGNDTTQIGFRFRWPGWPWKFEFLDFRFSGGLGNLQIIDFRHSGGGLEILSFLIFVS